MFFLVLHICTRSCGRATRALASSFLLLVPAATFPVSWSPRPVPCSLLPVACSWIRVPGARIWDQARDNEITPQGRPGAHMAKVPCAGALVHRAHQPGAWD